MLVLREITIADYDKLIELWTNMSGVGLSSADSRENIEKFLARNPKFSFVAETDGQVVGSILTGHDVRRGFIYHLAVKSECRRNGIARKLVAKCLERLKEEGILKCHLFVFADNETGNEFWSWMGWQQRDDLLIFSREI